MIDAGCGPSDSEQTSGSADRAEEEAESAKESLRVERAKMTREKKQWALDRKSEESDGRRTWPSCHGKSASGPRSGSA